MLEDESLLIIERVNGQMVSEATLLQGAAASVMGGKKGNAAFKKTLDKFRADTRPRSSAPKPIKWPPEEPDEER
jgi:hypothetical protein